MSLFWYALLCVLSSFAIILERTRELVALLSLSYGCLVAVDAMSLFLTVPWVGLQCDCGLIYFLTLYHLATVLLQKCIRTLNSKSFVLVFFANSVKRHFCDVKLHHWSMSDFDISRGFFFRETSHSRSCTKINPSQNICIYRTIIS